MSDSTSPTDLSQEMIDTLLGKSFDVNIGNRTFTVARASLGKILLLNEVTSQITPYIKVPDTMKGNRQLQSLYVIAAVGGMVKRPEQRALIIRSLAITLLNTRHELMSASNRTQVEQYITSHLSDEEIASLYINLRTFEDVDGYIKELGIGREIERMNKAQKVKKQSNTLTFCGVSVWGNLIDPIAERYGWTLDYILWGISFANIRMLMADRRKEVYLTDEERKKAHISTDGILVNGDDAEAVMAFIRANR